MVSYESYWELDRRPVLGQAFEEKGRHWTPSAWVRLPRWFSHLLPEGRLREAVANAAAVHEEREFFLLERIGGDDLPGGLRVVSNSAPGSEPGTGSDEPGEVVESNLGPLKFSLAGVQLKFSVRQTDRGLTLPARGQAGDWIVKLPDQRPGHEGVPEAELGGLELARACGIEVPDARLVDPTKIELLPAWASKGGGRALLIRRFDRTPSGGRVHVEELAQVHTLPTGKNEFKYSSFNFETVARTTGKLCGIDTVGQVIDRIVLNVLLGNGDAHAKNWAYTYPDGQQPVLSPAYDIVPTVLYVPSDDLGMNLARSKRFEDVTVRGLSRLSEKAGWSPDKGQRRATEAVERTVQAWPVLKEYLTEDAFSRLTRRRDALPLTDG